MRRILIYTAAAILAAALVRHLYRLGGPYLAAPATIQDHVARVPYPSRDAIVMSRRAAELIPRGATVAVLMPSQAPNHDPTLGYTAVGLMPHHKIVPPDLDAQPQYVISVREPLDHPAYRLVAGYAEGKVYVRR